MLRSPAFFLASQVTIVSSLGDFLVRLYGAGQPFTTVRARLSEWEDVALAKVAGHRRSRIGRHRPPTGNEIPQRREVTLAAWLRLPQQFRLERTTSGASRSRDGWEPSDGESTWSCRSNGEVTVEKCTKDPQHSIPVDIGRHFSAGLLREIISALALEEIGAVETAGRACVRLRATPRPGVQLWPHWLPHGADYYELHADPQTATLLYIAGYQGGQIFEVNEVAEVHFDEPVSDDLFRYAPAAGETIRPATPITERMSLADAVARMPFTVLIPQRLSSEAKSRREVMYQPSRSGEEGSLALFYGGGLWVRQGAQPDAELAELEFETVEHQGRTLQISDPGTGDGYLIATIEQDGTHVQFMFQGERAELLELATSLTPAQGIEP